MFSSVIGNNQHNMSILGCGAFLYEAYLTYHGNYTILGNKANYTGGGIQLAAWVPPPV